MKAKILNVLQTLKFSVVVVLAAGLSSISAWGFDYPARGDYALGAQQWADNCTRCHNLRGPNDLRDDQWITTMFHMRIRAGLTGEETRNILTFLQVSNDSHIGGEAVDSTAPSPTSTPNVSLSGKAIYDQTCIACHGENGKGAIQGVPDLGARLSQSEDVLLISIIRGMQSPGSAMAMPPKGGNPSLSEADIRSVIGYLRSSFGF